MSFKKSLKYLNDMSYQMDHIWEAPSRLEKSQALIFLKKSAIILRQDFLKTLYMYFLAPSGAKGVTLSVCLSGSGLWSVSGIFKTSPSAFLAYFVGQTEPKILRLVVLLVQS